MESAPGVLSLNTSCDWVPTFQQRIILLVGRFHLQICLTYIEQKLPPSNIHPCLGLLFGVHKRVQV